MFDLTRITAALYKFRNVRGKAKPTTFCGSAFVVHGGLMITCRHCLEDYPLGDGEYYGAVFELSHDGSFIAARIEDISFDPSGVDLATARSGRLNSPLKLSRGLAGIGHDVGTVGFPGTFGRLRDETSGPLQFRQESRWLEGYITRGFIYERPDRQEIRSWEIDMPAPSGLSGSPLLLTKTNQDAVLIGAVYGSHTVKSDVGSADAMPSGYPFALAHHLDSLHNLRGTALGSETLFEYMERNAMTTDDHATR